MTRRLLCVVLIAWGAAAEESTLERKLASLPPPGVAKDLEFEGHLRVKGAVLGPVRIMATGTGGKVPMWRLEVSLSAEQAGSRKSVVYLSERLAPVRGEAEERGQAGDRTVTWANKDGAIKVMDARPRTLTAQGPVMTNFASIVLFAHLAHSPARYKATLFNPTAKDPRKTLVEVGIEVKSVGEFFVVLARSHEALEAVFETASGRLLGLRLRNEAGLVLEFERNDPLFDGPAKDAAGVAARTAEAYAMSDVALLDSLIHWPTALATFRKQNPDREIDEQAFREGAMGSVARAWQQRESRSWRVLVRHTLRKSMSEVRIDKVGENRAVVTLPAAFKNLKFDVGEIDGSWRLRALP